MGEFALDSKLLILVVVIVLIIIIAVVLFNQRFQTQEERDENRNKLIMGIVVASIVAVGVYLLVVYYAPVSVDVSNDQGEGMMGERPEEGIFTGAKETWAGWRLKQKLRAEARRKYGKTLSSREIDAKVDAAYAKYRSAKVGAKGDVAGKIAAGEKAALQDI